MLPPSPELTAWVSLIKDVVTGCAAVAGAGVALLGLSAWRKQLKGKTDYELARKLLRAAYKVRDAIRFVRRPAIWTSEAAAAQKEVAIVNDRLKENPRAASDFAVYQVRWNKLADAIAELEAEAFEAEISWGTSVKAKLDELVKMVGHFAGQFTSTLSRWWIAILVQARNCRRLAIFFTIQVNRRSLTILLRKFKKPFQHLKNS